MINEEYSKDAIFNGAVTIVQSRKGYRFSVDALLLAWYVSRLPGTNALELGTGSGVISLALAHKRPGLALTAVEIQKSLYDVARVNLNDNCSAAIRLLHTDYRKLNIENNYDFAFANPPFRENGRGRLNPHPEKAAARHELNGTLAELIRSAKKRITGSGFISLVLLYERLADVEQLAILENLHIIQRTDIYPYAERDPNLFLITLSPEHHELADSSLTIWRDTNNYTPELENILAGAWSGNHPLSALI